ncbi:MAG: COG1361 S-layer family protein, partial [Methanosarcinaceae archaeon]
MKPSNIHKIQRFLSIIGVFALIFTIMIPMVSAEESSDDSPKNTKVFMAPNYAFSINYYNSYGVPDLYASLLGDTEFERGETAQVRITLVNKGVLYGFKYDKSVGTDEGKHALSLKELEYETMRTTAIGLKAELISTTPYIDIDPTASARVMEKLVPGKLPEKPLVYVITISDNAPAGAYYLQLPVSYEYQSNIRMTTNEVYRLGVVGLDHTTNYKSANKTLIIPISVKPATKFEVTDVSGHLTAGSLNMINNIQKYQG